MGARYTTGISEGATTVPVYNIEVEGSDEPYGIVSFEDMIRIYTLPDLKISNSNFGPEINYNETDNTIYLRNGGATFEIRNKYYGYYKLKFLQNIQTTITNSFRPGWM